MTPPCQSRSCGLPVVTQVACIAKSSLRSTLSQPQSPNFPLLLPHCSFQSVASPKQTLHFVLIVRLHHLAWSDCNLPLTADRIPVFSSLLTWQSSPPTELLPPVTCKLYTSRLALTGWPTPHTPSGAAPGFRLVSASCEPAALRGRSTGRPAECGSRPTRQSGWL